MEIDARASLRPVGLNKRVVALVGFGDSRIGAAELSDDIPIWSLNDAESYGISRLGCVFEMHPFRDLVLETPRWEKLKQEQDYPIIMLEQNDKIPSSVKFPLDAALELAFENIQVGDTRAKYITATFGYMLITAVMAGFDTIYLFGFEFLSDTEHTYQAIGAALLIGWAAGKGVKVILPEGNPLLPPTLYGYEDYQMISRSNLEQMLGDLANMESDWLGKLNTAHAQVVERQRHNYLFRFFNSIAKFFAKHSDIKEADEARGEAWKQLYMTGGGLQLTRHFIDIIDRKEQALGSEFKDNLFISGDSDG